MNAKFQLKIPANSSNSTSLTLFILLLLFISTVSDALHSKKSPHHTDDDSIEEGSGMIPDDEDLATEGSGIPPDDDEHEHDTFTSSTAKTPLQPSAHSHTPFSRANLTGSSTTPTPSRSTTTFFIPSTPPKSVVRPAVEPRNEIVDGLYEMGTVLIISAIIACAVVIMFIATCIICCCCRRRRHYRNNPGYHQGHLVSRQFV